MKTAIIATVVAVLALFASLAFATTAPTSAPTTYAAPAQDFPVVSVDLDGSPVYTVREVVIAAAPTHKAPRAKVWTCGPMTDNLIGGRNRTCEWK